MNVRTVDLAILRDNIRLIRSSLPQETLLMAVVKADAYGHGLVQTARAAIEAGAAWLAVARAEEGVRLRDAGIKAPVLVLGAASREDAPLAIEHGLHMAICGEEDVWMLAEEAERLNLPAMIHLKLDTGMSRIGARTQEEVLSVLLALKGCPEVQLTGAFTHFADADGDDMTFTYRQLERFRELTALLPEGILRHCANSAAIHRLPQARFDMVRAGISMYGYPPVETDMSLKPAMDWRTRVTYVKDIAPGDAVSYGSTFRADKPLRVATVACGYGDGYHRAASGKAQVIIRGRLAPVIGRICMDQMMADVTGIPGVCAGDEVILLGRDGDAELTAEDLAAWAGTISYEVLLAATDRVGRVWRHEWTDKAALRQNIRERFPGQMARSVESTAICLHILGSSLYEQAGTVAAYMPQMHEADVTAVVTDVLKSGRKLLLPRMDAEGVMTLRRVERIEGLRPGAFGILEPPEDAPEVPPDQADLIIVPLEAIDDTGLRLGKGGGCYDRLLARSGKAKTLGAVLSWQWVKDVPADSWDQRLTAACDRQGIRYFDIQS